jgi:hypothetical protein
LNTDFKVFAVASNIGAAGYVDGYDLIMHKHWISNEAMKSSTWREVYKELYLGSLVLIIFANLCIVCTPHILSSKLKNANELPQSSISMILLKASTFSSRFLPLESIMHKHWISNEAMKSSTWREVKAI